MFLPSRQRERGDSLSASTSKCFPYCKTISISLICYFMSKPGCHSERVTLSTLSVKPRVCRKSTRHFNDDHLQDPPGYHWIPGLHGSISPSDEKKESRGTRCSEVCYSCPLRLTGVPICLGFQQLQRSPACREWNIYWVRGTVNFANACQFVQLPLRVWGNFYALWQNIPNLSLNIWQLFTECNCVSFIMMIS